ncbi:MAG: hypothetical protein KF795_20085 [Labilithrix sp.]|nr:hypothetical protein [Labilithrix sp.]
MTLLGLAMVIFAASAGSVTNIVLACALASRLFLPMASLLVRGVRRRRHIARLRSEGYDVDGVPLRLRVPVDGDADAALETRVRVAFDDGEHDDASRRDDANACSSASIASVQAARAEIRTEGPPVRSSDRGSSGGG